MKTPVSAIANIDIPNKRLLPIRLTIGIFTTLSKINQAIYDFIWIERGGFEPAGGMFLNLVAIILLGIPSGITALITTNPSYLLAIFIAPLFTALNASFVLARNISELVKQLVAEIKSNMPEN